MVDKNEDIHRHFILEGVTNTEGFRSPQQGGGRSEVPSRDRSQHGADLQRYVDELRQSANAAREAQLAAGMEEGLGLQVEFESFPGIELAFESLARERSGIELLNVRESDSLTFATVFIPDGKLEHFENLIGDYLAEKRDSIGRPRDNRRLIDAIRQIRVATLQALWTDDLGIPTPEDGNLWWEVWISVKQDQKVVVEGFRERAASQGMRVSQGEVVFPERTVLLVNASVEQMQDSIALFNGIAELRRAKETADFFNSMSVDEQNEWVSNLASRTSVVSVSSGHDVPYVSLLDTGVNRGHSLLAPALEPVDLHTVNPVWGIDDADDHGTEMAGLALIGNLTDVLASNDPVNIEHRLESVKLLSRSGATGQDPSHHGYITTEAVARLEVTDPSRLRVFSMAVTAQDNRDRGRPSAWSSSLDSLAAAVSSQPSKPRLLVVSAGNTDQGGWENYPASNDTDEIHDPAQAWNVLTVGAYTNLVHITEPGAQGHQTIAPVGGLSPFSTTSLTWPVNLPLKPDVVFEGGNAAKDGISAVSMPSLSLLTTYHRPAERLLTTTGATSAATALASRMAAQIMVEYPQLWPETIRALVVHSAEWTDAMKLSYLPENPHKSDYLGLIRRCGFGVPDLSRALWTLNNSLTMIVQDSLRPFERQKGKPATNREMHLHNLPWPHEMLAHLGKRRSRCVSPSLTLLSPTHHGGATLATAMNLMVSASTSNGLSKQLMHFAAGSTLQLKSRNREHLAATTTYRG